jgi:hypothetical protein
LCSITHSRPRCCILRRLTALLQRFIADELAPAALPRLNASQRAAVEHALRRRCT